MCLNCFKEEGYTVEHPSEKILEAVMLIKELYNTFEGGAGGYGHVVFDDWNLDCIDSCLKDAYSSAYDMDEETRKASIRALEYCNKLTENELANALRLIALERQ
jgi:hypothetical protein